ncbi:hypothetical protein PSECIP111854_03400 [Pseudoalteromonas sp. CIP111854]|uniref:Uncharacterized protein n=1 Tax=Pseudoalteromonas holothuriae TaxID=2963714 RepID=A0A9W4R2H7_9GAMM|nr:hypothetical protein [Pseudoalteromonas sp. CIP111854]CAH9064241.1 hypothetical protein PSECIP111854_03400 [Pseudoalteromonas sp. CIP111854]
MDILTIQKDLDNLLVEVENAKRRGYKHAEVVLTPEIRDLIPKIKAGTLKSYVKLEYTAGPFRCLVETLPENCIGLDRAWHQFKFSVQGYHENSDIQSLLEKISNIKVQPNTVDVEAIDNDNKTPSFLSRVKQAFKFLKK